MGQTLTHGVYLPDEGERNCYSGLAANWQLLDSSVGTVAEHTSVLAGKAPLVHTHVKSDITDFPAYGNAAGTICEGNDSRLSDARTPVAHTHGKADITDLFNSANTWTNSNTYSKAITVEKSSDTDFFFKAKHTAAELGSLPSSDQSITWAFKDKNDDNLCYARVYYETTGGNSFRIFVRNKYASGAPSTSGTADYAYFGLKINADKSKEGVLRGTFRPYDNNTYDLGSSSYKWKTLNGINPGALSLPKGYTEEGADKHYINIASTIQTLDGTLYNYTMPDNGWICVRAEQAQQVHVTIQSWGFGQSISHPTGSTLIVAVPFRKNDTISLKVKAITLQYARFYPMQGNV